MPKRGKYDNLKTLEDIQKYIDELEIKSFNEIHKKYPALKARLYKLGYRSNDLKLDKPPQKDWSSYNTLEDFQKFINEHNIQNRTQFEKGEYSGLYTRAVNLKINDKLHYLGPTRKNYSFISSIEDIQNFIYEHNIQNNKELVSKFPGIFNKMTRLKIDKSKLIYPNQLRQNLSCLNTIQDFQSYIYAHNIKSLQEFKRNYSGVLARLYNLGLSTSLLDFELSNQSYSEMIVTNFLDLAKVDYVKQKQFNDLPKLRFDFYLTKYNIAIECQGEQHLIAVDYWGGEDGLRKRKERDNMKVNYCKRNGIKLFRFYLFSKKSAYSYLTELEQYEYTDFNKFMFDILKNILE